MNLREAAWLAHQRRRWMLPDPSRWLQPDRSKWMRPEAAWHPSPDLHERKYSPDQPRVPAGSAEGGQWTDAGGAGETRDGGGDEAERPGKTSPQTSATPDPVRIAADNQRQNKMVRDIAVQLRLSKDQKDQLHREISSQGYGYHQILQLAKEMFGK